jgi:hypothetical protein
MTLRSAGSPPPATSTSISASICTSSLRAGADGPTVSPRRSSLRVAGALAAGLLLSWMTPSLAAADPGGVRGMVVDAESGEPVPAAQVQVLEAVDPESGETPRMLGAVLAGPDGSFLLRDLPEGEVVLSVVSIGFAPLEGERILIRGGSVTDAGTLRLRPQAIQVEGLSIESRRSAVSFEPDRTVYRIEGMPTVGGGSLSDALGSVPELDLDFEGRVEFEGNTPEIYLNGRPAPVDGESLLVFLEQFPADRIDRIEVIPNPSARYDAEGAGGIVNIVLADDVELGLSGNVFANAGTRGSTGSGGRLAWQEGDLTVQAGGFLRHSRQERASSNLRENLLADPVTRVEQDRLNRSGGLTGGGDLNVEYQAGERTLVWSRVRGNDLGSDSDGSVRSLWTDAGGGPLESSLRNSAVDRDRISLDVQGGVQVTLDDERGDHEFSVELRRDRRTTDSWRSLETALWADEGADEGFPGWNEGEWPDLETLPGDPELLLRLDRTLQERSRIRTQVDYVRPVSGLELEMGLRGQWRDNENVRSVEVGEPGAATGFRHEERFLSAFTTAAGSVGPLGVQVGIRIESALVDFNLEGAGDPLTQRYTSLFPTANLSWHFDGGQQLRLSYGQRIRRPSPRRVNPVDRSDDPLLREVGNPDLRPQYTHNVRLDASWRGSAGTLRLTPFLRYTTDEWARIRRVDVQGVATETWENVATTRQVGSSLSVAVREMAGFRGSVRVSGRRELRSDEALALEARGGSALRWSVRGNVDREFGRNLSAQARVRYNPAREIPQGFVSSSVLTTFGIRARFLDRRASVNLSVRDPFNVHDQTFESRDPSHRELRTSVPDSRAATVSISYTLGSMGR